MIWGCLAVSKVVIGILFDARYLFEKWFDSIFWGRNLVALFSET